MPTKGKLYAGITAFSLAALIVTGTFAWTSFNSSKVNEWRGAGSLGAGAGGTLHDDHIDNENRKDVYVENWGTEDLFVRIRLTEYMEAGEGAGLKSTSKDPTFENYIPNADNLSKSIIGYGDINNLNTWQDIWYRFPEDGDLDTGIRNVAALKSYWKWDMGGQKFYYPAPADKRDDKSYVDQNSPDNLTAASKNNAGVQAKQTLPATVMTMAEWKKAGMPVGNFWVIDRTYQHLTPDKTGIEGNWAYWAAPLKPGEATGLLLTKVTLIDTAFQQYGKENESINGLYYEFDKGYYYGINVVAQMATKTGTIDNTVLPDNYIRFGDPANGGWSNDGQALMELIVANTTPSSSILYNFTLEVGEGGSLPDSVDNIIHGQYEAGTSISVIAQPILGVPFYKWISTDNKGTFDDATKLATTFIMPNSDVTVTAVFRQGTIEISQD